MSIKARRILPPRRDAQVMKSRWMIVNIRTDQVKRDCTADGVWYLSAAHSAHDPLARASLHASDALTQLGARLNTLRGSSALTSLWGPALIFLKLAQLRSIHPSLLPSAQLKLFVSSTNKKTYTIRESLWATFEDKAKSGFMRLHCVNYRKPYEKSYGYDQKLKNTLLKLTPNYLE